MLTAMIGVHALLVILFVIVDFITVVVFVPCLHPSKTPPLPCNPFFASLVQAPCQNLTINKNPCYATGGLWQTPPIKCFIL